MKASTVWIIDDDEDDQLVIRAAFGDGEHPVEVRALNDGDELLSQLAACDELPRLILLDINMPRKNGFETLKDLRSITDFAHLPVIMLTTSSDEKDRQHSMVLGATHFLTKPRTYPLLRQLVQELSRQWKLA